MKRKKSPYNAKKPPAKRSKTVESKVSTLARRVSRVQRDIEHKYYEVGFNGDLTHAILNGAGVAIYQSSLVDMASGDTVNTRTAAQIRVKKISIKGTITTDREELIPTPVLVYVVLDKQCNGASAFCPYNGENGVYEDLGGTIPSHVVQQNVNTTKTRYKVLAEKRFVINPNVIYDYEIATGTTAELIPVSKKFEINLNMNQLIQYITINSGNSAILSNNISINVVVPTLGGGIVPKLSILSRSEFTDA